MFHNFQNYDSHITFLEIGKYNYKINAQPKATEKHISFTIQQPKWKSTERRLLFIADIHFSKNSLLNLVKNLGENDFYRLSKEFIANFPYD